MKTKKTVGIKKQTVTVKDLKTRKNPKGGCATGQHTSLTQPSPNS